jgi:hypothetical protein
MDINEFAKIVLDQSRERMARDYTQWQADAITVEVIPGPKYTKIDRDHGHGYLMVENATGEIYGILGYGKVNKSHNYGTLDTVAEYFWGDYSPVPVVMDSRTFPAWEDE